MKVDTYILHCSKCNPSGFRLIKANKVKITLDLNKDEYVFDATCPKCKGKIYNRRRRQFTGKNDVRDFIQTLLAGIDQGMGVAMTAKYRCQQCEDPCVLEIAARASTPPEDCPWGGFSEWEEYPEPEPKKERCPFCKDVVLTGHDQKWTCKCGFVLRR